MSPKAWQTTHFKHHLNRLKRKYVPVGKRIFIALVLAVVTSMVSLSGVGVDSDQWLLRQYFAIRGPIKPPSNLLLITLDDLTYKKLDASPRWPFPRKHFASALEALVKAGPKVAILDLAALKEDEDEVANNRIKEALHQGNFTLATGFLSAGTSGKVSLTDDPESILFTDSRFLNAAKMHIPMLLRVERGITWQIAAPVSDGSSDEENSEPGLYDYFPLLRPLNELAHLNLSPPGTRDLINFYGPPGAIPSISLYQLVVDSPESLYEKIHDKVVLVGYQSYSRMRGQIDKEAFPVSVAEEVMYGVEIHSNIVGNFIDGSPIRRLSRQDEINIVFTFTTFVVFGALSLALTQALLAVFSALIGLTLVGGVAFLYLYYFIPGILIIWVATICCLLPVSLIRIFEEQKLAKVLRKSFGLEG